MSQGRHDRRARAVEVRRGRSGNSRRVSCQVDVTGLIITNTNPGTSTLRDRQFAAPLDDDSCRIRFSCASAG